MNLMYPEPKPSIKRASNNMPKASNNKAMMLWTTSRLACSSGGLIGMQDTSDRVSRKEEVTCTVIEREQDDFSHLRSW